MHNEFEAIIEKNGEWFIAYSPEIPGANRQGHTAEKARIDLANAIALILEDRREDALRGLPPNVIRSTVVIA
jgi:predicted RNase H-like HicB family nuclease